MSNQLVSVALGERRYDIHIGPKLLEQAGDLLTPHLSRSRVTVVTDENVLAAQGERLKAGLQKAGIDAAFISLAPGEATKSFGELERLTGQLLDLGVERGDLIVAFGGGVIGDLTGFAAAILRRGCRFAQMPTSLLAQVDSAVGGKTAINTAQGKNLVGAFHQPAIVLADTSTLNTLSKREMRAGYAEVIKYGLISDAAFFTWLEANGKALLAGGEAERQHAIKTSCKAKADIVAADEREHGARALLNLGHTFGHAFEAAYGYSGALLHGEAVALGMALAFDYSAEQGLCPPDDAARAKAHIAAAGLPSQFSDLPDNQAVTVDNLVTSMMQDKKVERGKLTLILANGVGKASTVKDASLEDVQSFLRKKVAR